MSETPIADLERALADLGGRLDVPAAPRLAAAVRARIETAPGPRRVRLGMTPFRRRSLALGLAILSLLLAGAAVASYFGVRGVKIIVTPSPSLTPAPSPNLDLGVPVTLEQARRSAGFPVAAPPAELGEPDEIYLGSSPTLRVSYAYRPRPGLPAVAGTDLGALVMQFRGALERNVLAKVIDADESSLRSVTVGGAPGIWIEGPTHFVAFLDPGGNFVRDTVRLAGSVLLWQRGDVTLRLESGLSLEDALRIAVSIR
jgi:hypothetical protein